MSRLRSNKVVNQAGSGAPELTYGAVIPNTGTISGAGKVSIGGSITAASFHGDGSSLSGIDASALKDGNNVKVQATATGATVTGDITATNATFSGNLTVQGTTTTIDTAVTSVDSLAVDGTISSGGTVTAAGIYLADNAKLNFGSGDDLQIYHDSNNSIIKDAGTGNITVQTNNINFINAAGSQFLSKFIESGAVELYHNGDKKFETTADGVDILGTGSIKVPVGTTAQRNGSPTAGDFRYNSTEGKFEGYTTEWGEIGGGGGITTEAHVANNAVVTLDLTAAQDHKVTATGICTITCTGGTEATSHTIRIINSGSATVGFSTYFLFPSGNAPVLPSTDGAINLVSFTVNRVGAAGTQLLAGASLNFS
jgi:hypothetical protein